jgi:hypothetical protein
VVLFESFTPACVLVFLKDLTAVGIALGKSDSGQDRNLQLTRVNNLTIRDHRDRYRELATQIWLAPFAEASPS